MLNYNEIQNHRKRKGIIDFDLLMDLLGIENYDDLKEARGKWVDSAIKTDNSDKENKWTQSIAVGSKTFIEKLEAISNSKRFNRNTLFAVVDRLEVALYICASCVYSIPFNDNQEKGYVSTI